MKKIANFWLFVLFGFVIQAQEEGENAVAAANATNPMALVTKYTIQPSYKFKDFNIFFSNQDVKNETYLNNLSLEIPFIGSGQEVKPDISKK